MTTTLMWDEVGSRTYETGLDKGVLYLPDGSSVPWNGLVDVIEKSVGDSTSVFFDGIKINNLAKIGTFKGTLKAITYPDEFDEVQGLGKITSGLFYGEQRPKVFGLCWRTRIGNDIDQDLGYKLHILYNITAIPADKTYSTITDDPNISVFEWDILAVPGEVTGFRPTAHVILDSRHMNPALLTSYEVALYGDGFSQGALIPLSNFANSLYFEYVWKIVDNGDGTWTAFTPNSALLTFDVVDPDLFTLTETNASYWVPNTYEISDVLAP